MSRLLRALLCIVAGFALAAGVAIAATWAVRWRPSFYVDALKIAPADARRGGDAALHRATSLSNDFHKPGPWQVSFEAWQLNGWLATDLVESHAKSIPAGFEAPRVGITPQQVVVAAKARWAGVSAVAWIAVEPFLAEPNVVALRIRRIRAGRMPLPQKQVLAAINEAARNADLRIQWRQTDGDPVALVTIPSAPSHKGHAVQVTGLRLEDGRITISGVTEKR